MKRQKAQTVLAMAMLLAILASAQTAFAGWTDVTPAVSTKTLFGVWGTSPSDVYVVGSDGKILHYNGTDWSEETSNTTSQLSAVWGSSSTNIYAVGKVDDVESSVTLLHKTSSGTTWGKEPLKDYKTDDEYNSDLSSVWGFSGNAVYVGTKNGYVLLFDGTGWYAIDPSPYIGSCAVTGIWGVNSTNLFIVDGCSNDVSKYDGVGWPYEDTGNTGNLNEIWGTSLNNIYVAGTNGFIGRYNGTSWLAVSSGTSKELHSIHGSSAMNLIAVGIQGAIVHNKGAGFIDESFSTSNDLFGVWVSRDGSVAYAVGTDGMILKWVPDPITTTTTIAGGTTTTIPGGVTTTVPGSTTTTVPGGVTTSIVPPGEVGADFIGNPLSGRVPLQVQFTNLSGGDIASYQWTFGDGGASTEKNPSHVYEKRGTYSVILTVIGSNNKTATKIREKYITVKSRCAIIASVDSRSQIETLRAARDANLEDLPVMFLTSLYYQDTAEINALLDEKPVLRARLKELVRDNIGVVEALVQGRPATLSSETLAGMLDYLEELRAGGSLKLQMDIDLVLLGLRSGYLLDGLNITVK